MTQMLVFFFTFLASIQIWAKPQLNQDVGILHLLAFDSDLGSFGAFATRHPDHRLLLLMAGHCVRQEEGFSVIFGKASFVAGARGGVSKVITNERLLAYFPTAEGDLAIFDLNNIEISSRNDKFVSEQEVPTDSLEFGQKLLSLATNSLFGDPFVRSCEFRNIEKIYKNGIQLARMNCDLPAEMKNGRGTSGSPIVLENARAATVVIVRGGFDKSQTSVAIAIFDISQVLENQSTFSVEDFKKRVLSKEKLKEQLSTPY